jgi:hypothetical protein
MFERRLVVKQRQRREDNRDRGESHSPSSNPGRDDRVEDWERKTSGDRDGDHVVSQGPEEVAPDAMKDGSREINGNDDREDISSHQNHVSAFHGDICSSSHRYPHVSLGNCTERERERGEMEREGMRRGTGGEDCTSRSI